MLKKYTILFLVICSFFFLSCISLSCKENSEKNNKSDQLISSNNGEFELKDEYFQDTFINPEDFFNLDYTPYLPEEYYYNKKLPEAENVALQEGTKFATKNISSIIPGLRDISKYDTVYNTNIALAADKFYDDTITGSIAANGSVTQSNDEDFTVVTWGPQKEIPAKIRKPEFYIVFSEPVVPIAALGSEIKETDKVEIIPPLEGVFRWNGTDTLSFIPSEPIEPQHSYKIIVSENLKSLSGKEIKGERYFSTVSEKLKILWFEPGFKYSEKNFCYFSDDDVPPEAAKELRVRFNYMVNADEIAKQSAITVGNKYISDFNVIQESSDTVTYNINADIPPETTITLNIGNLVKVSYNSVSKFNFDYIYLGSSYGKISTPIYINFSHPIDKSTVLENITTSLDYKLTEDNIKVNNETIMVYGLPVTFNSKLKINIGQNLQDIYGRKLQKSITEEIEIPDADSYINFTDRGSRILEAQYPPAMVFEYQNLLEDSFYSVSKTDNPLDIASPNWDLLKVNDKSIKLKTEPKNTRIFEKVDLDPYLTNGKGMVRFEATASIPLRNNKYNPKTDRTNVVTIQVTDLGVTARLGVNKTVVLVTKLSDGSPVENAKVYLYNSYNNSITDALENESLSLGTAVTDKNGVAVINYDARKGAEWFASDYQHLVDPALLVTTADDAVTFNPTTHSPWRNNVYSTANISSSLDILPSTFMFSDRGLYKPGETVTFRGIDRNLNLGTYIPVANAPFSVEIRDTSYNVIGNITGTTSSNGGFNGSFIIPEDATPGNFSIKYKRNIAEKNCVKHTETLNVTVAFFERVKFQTGIKIPDIKYTTGDTIQCPLSASYLAGGVLASAEYNSAWYSEPWYFETEDSAFKDYRFGPLNNYENMRYLNTSYGNLDNSGKALLSCSTSENNIKGSPFRYKVSVDVTDVSNQMISTSAAVVVHPASYYIGVHKQDGMGYLVKKDSELNFDYKLALLDGTEATSIKGITGKSPKLKVELLREDWNTIQQQGIGGNIYPRYVKEIVTESTNTLDLATSGTFSIKPKEVGYYTLRLSSKDNKNRDVVTEYSLFSTGSTNNWVMNSTEETLKLTPDQKLYNPGEKATILLESPLPKGTYLITVEREGIFTEEVKTFDSAVNTIEIPIARNYIPVCYVSVSSYSVRTEEPNNEYGVADVDKPKGYYGVTALHINPYVKAFSVDVKTKKLAYKPGEEAEIIVTATKGGKPLANAEITLMAVDRGVLDLIDYHVPNPIEFFYNEGIFPLRVKGGDNRDSLMDPVTYAIKNLAGGDALTMAKSSAEDKLNERKDFNPTALFEPVLITDENGQAKCKFKLPDSLTTYRITAFGVKDELLALQESEFQVHNPVNVQQVTPRRLRERDTSELGVILTNLDSVPHEMTISLATISPDKIEAINGVTKQPGKAIVDGDSKHTVNVNPGSTIAVYFDVAAKKAGIINAEFTVTSDILNEKLIYPVTIEKPYIFETVTSTGYITGDNKTAKEGIIIPSFAEDGLGDISVTLDATRLGPLGSSVKYVFDYPYGCLEQQASKILPLLIFEDYIDVFNIELDEKITDIHDLVVSYFKEWSKTQFKNGGFGYWPISEDCSFYVTARIAQTYAIALERGYTAKELKIDGASLINFLSDTLKAGGYTYKYGYTTKLSNYEKVFIRYVLSMLAPETISISDVKTVLNDKESTVSELALSGLTALELGDKELGKEFKTEINKFLRPDTQSVDITASNNNYYWSMYNSTVEHLALTLKLFVEIDAQDPLVTKLIFTLFKNQQKGYWQNTSNTARVFDAFYSIIKAADLDHLNLKASCNLNGEELASGKFKGPAAKPVKKTFLFSDLEEKGIKPGSLLPLEFEKSGKGDLYFTTSMKYALPSELQIPRAEGISVIYKLYNEKTGEEVTFDSKDSSLVKLESGVTYKMDITITSSKDRNYIAVRAPVPSGAEILDATFVTAPDGVNSGSGRSQWNEDDIDDGYYSGSYYMDNQTILDNEVQYFWNYFPKGTTKATFKFRAARKGVFPTPPITAECMYESEIFGRTYGSLYTIE